MQKEDEISAPPPAKVSANTVYYYTIADSCWS